MARTPLSEAELEEHLADQLKMLINSARQYDAGDTFEYRRMALVIRILVHESKTSRSLLGQLKRQGIAFFDSAIPLTPGNLLPESGLTVMVSGGERSGHQAPLDDPRIAQATNVPFDQWWTSPILKDSMGRFFTRKSLVLTAANQDGGAHIDPQLDANYADLSRNETSGWWKETAAGVEFLPVLERAAIRQIAHEVLKTFVTDYEKRPEFTGSISYAAVQLGTDGETTDEFFFGTEEMLFSAGATGGNLAWMKELVASSRPQIQPGTPEYDELLSAAFAEPVGKRAKRRSRKS